MRQYNKDLISNIDPIKLSEISDFEAAFFKWPWSQENWKQLASCGREIYCIWAEEEEIEGICVFETSSTDFCHLYKIIVHPDYRRRSIAKSLFNDMLNYCHQLFDDQIFQVYLEVEAANDGAISFYESLGLEKIHLKKNFYADGSNAVTMQRVVS